MSNIPTGESAPTQQTETLLVRDEQEVFSELAGLCASPGYIHSLAFLYLSNNWVTFKDEVTAAAALVRTSPGLLV